MTITITITMTITSNEYHSPKTSVKLTTTVAHKGLGLRKVLKKVLKKALKKILLTQKRTQKSKCTFLSTQRSTQ